MKDDVKYIKLWNIQEKRGYIKREDIMKVFDIYSNDYANDFINNKIKYNKMEKIVLPTGFYGFKLINGDENNDIRGN